MTSGKESAQIAILRILCIAFMLSAHVRPPGDAGTGAAADAIALIQALWVDFLGRAGLAGLSFADLRFAAPSALLLLAAFAALHAWRGGSPVLAALGEFARRGLLVVLFLGVAGTLSEAACGAFLAALSTSSLEIYLLHLPLFNAMWILWNSAIGPPEGWSWVGLFLTSSAAAIAAGRLLAHALDRSPAAAQIAFRGRIRRRDVAVGAPLSRRIASAIPRGDIGGDA